MFLPPPALAKIPPAPARSRDVPLDDGGVRGSGNGGGVRELDRRLDVIAISVDYMDEDVVLALFGDFEEGGFEEILDDFCITAGQDAALVEEEGKERGAGGGLVVEFVSRPVRMRC